MIVIDVETGLEIGDPDELPFKDTHEIDLVRLQENIEKRLRDGVASASGIRQIFDNTYGDETTDYTEGTSTEITDAAKIHIATIADSFVELLQNHTGKQKPTIAVAIDTRHTGPIIADTAIRILVSHGTNIKYTFITPITELAIYSREVTDGFIYISASHNPRGYNGLKLGLDDGRLLPGNLARQFISNYQSKLTDIQNTKAMILRANSADPDRVREVFDKISLCRKDSRNRYGIFSDMIITGIKDPSQAEERKKLLSKEILSRDIWIGVDYNGGARKDKEYLESWGFHVVEINNRPRLDMVHDLSPVPDACQQAKDALIRLQKEGKNVIAFFVFDTDGDRKNIVIPDGKSGASIPGVQMIFALDVLASVYNAGCNCDNLWVVVNDATSSIMRHLADLLGFRIKTVEVGEANVASAGVKLSQQGMCVPIMGEGSNGSVLNLDLLVREPRHTLRTIIEFITKPEMIRLLLKRLGQEDKYDDWHSSANIGGLFMNIINALPPSITTDFFTDEGIRKSKHDIPQSEFKTAFDEYFQSYLWHRIADEIEKTYRAKPIAEFVNYEGEDELLGRGNRITGTGGYKVEFYVQTQDGKKRYIGWIWFRCSATERGIMRKGVSISHWETTPQAKDVVNHIYNYMNKTLNDAFNIVEKKILEETITEIVDEE